MKSISAERLKEILDLLEEIAMSDNYSMEDWKKITKWVNDKYGPNATVTKVRISNYWSEQF